MSLESSLWSRTSDFRIQGSYPWSLTRGRASQFFSLTRVIKKMPDPALTLCLLPITHNCAVTICSGSVGVSKNFGSADDCNNHWPPNMHCLQPGGVSLIQPLASFSLAQTAHHASGAVQMVFSDRRWACEHFRGSVTAPACSKRGPSQHELQTCPSAPRQPAHAGTTPDAQQHWLPGFPTSQGAAWILLSFLLLSLALLLPCTFRSISCAFYPPKLGKGFPWVPPVISFWPLSKYCSISLPAPLKWAVNKGVN